MHSASVEAKEINERLERIYGRHLVKDKPKFRVSWSEDQYEKSFGERNIFVDGKFLRTEQGIAETPKYHYLDNQWVVEILYANHHPDVFEDDYIYEPLFAFPTGLPLKWEPVERVVQVALGLIKSDTPKTQKEAEYRENERVEEEKRTLRHELDEISNPSNIELNLRDGDAVSFAGKKFGEN